MNKNIIAIIGIIISGVITLSFCMDYTPVLVNLLTEKNIRQIEKLKNGVIRQDTNEEGTQCNTNSIIKQKDYIFTIFDYFVYPQIEDESYYSSTELEEIYNNSALEKLFGDTIDYSTVYTPVSGKRDTIELVADFHMSLSGLKVNIHPFAKSKEEHYTLSIALDRQLKEDAWYSDKVRWSDTTPFIPIKDSAQFYYQIPDLDKLGEDMFSELKTSLQLRDTLVELSGEIAGSATVVYKEKPCIYIQPGCVLRIEKYKGRKLKDTKYIHIEFSLGC